MEEEKQYGCSIAPRIINKNERNDQDAFKNGFTAGIISLNQLKEFIKKGGAFSYAYKNDVRSSSNFIGTEILAADVDKGLTIEEALELPFVKNHAQFLYTTTSHTQENHRFRIVFTFQGGITNAEELQQVVTAISARVSGDMSVTDSARIFYGSRGCEIYDIGNELTQEIIDDLRIQGKELIDAKRGSKDSERIVNRSSRLLDNELMVTLRDGQSIALSSIDKKTTIFCPDHTDNHPSAFVGFGSKGGRFIFCHACQTTRWLKGDLPKFDFDSFEKVVKEIGLRSETQSEVKKFFAGEYELIKKVGGRVHLSNEQKFSIQKIYDGITFVKSPKGSGKTTMLPIIMRPLTFDRYGHELDLSYIEENEDIDGKPLFRLTETEFSVLLIGHRQALISELCHRIGLNCYLEDYHDKPGFDPNKRQRFRDIPYLRRRQKRYGVCLDSLPILLREKYDLIIIDESEQVLSHFLSGTMDEKRYSVFSQFKDQLSRANHVICLDADLSWITFNTICNLALAQSYDDSSGQDSNDKRGKRNKETLRPVNIFLNEFKKQNEELKLYKSKDQLIRELEIDVADEKKIFFTSNSKKQVKKLTLHLSQKFPDKKILCVTADNSRSKEIQAILKDVKYKIRNYDVILTSPSISTGVDITFDNEEKIIDVVYGFFEGKITDHFEIDQQVLRVRHPKAVKIWISPQKFYFETDISILPQSLQLDNLSANTYAGSELTDLSTEWGQRSAFYRMSTQIESKRRASFNSLKENYVDYKVSQGYHITLMEKDDQLATEGSKIKKQMGQDQLDKEISEILTSDPIDQTTFIRISQARKNSQPVSEKDGFSHLKARIEFNYRSDVTPEIITHSLDRGINKIIFFENILRCAQVDMGSGENVDSLIFPKEIMALLKKKINEEHPDVLSIEDELIQTVLWYEILKTVPFFVQGKFDPSIEIKQSDLNNFVEVVKKFKNVLSTYRFPVRSDFKKLPMKTLGELLKPIGLALRKSRRDQSGGVTTYHYKVDEVKLEFMMGIVNRRKNWSVDEYIPFYWKGVHNRYGFTSPIYIRNPNGMGVDEWDVEMREDLEKRFREGKEAKGEGSLLERLANE